jgi:hypothetical protein
MDIDGTTCLTRLVCACVLYLLEYGPAMIEHIILEAGLDPNMKVTTQFDSSEGK